MRLPAWQPQKSGVWPLFHRNSFYRISTVWTSYICLYFFLHTETMPARFALIITVSTLDLPHTEAQGKLKSDGFNPSIAVVHLCAPVHYVLSELNSRVRISWRRLPVLPKRRHWRWKIPIAALPAEFHSDHFPSSSRVSP